MARIAPPGLDPRLRGFLLPILTNRCLDNDAVWQSEISPLIQTFLNNLGHSIRQSATTNANAPSAKMMEEIQKTLSGILGILSHTFAENAPFTVYRVAELVLAYNDSGYSLTTVIQAQKWLSALLRALSISSTESAYNQKPGFERPSLSTGNDGISDNEISEDERRRLDLPTNIRFVRLDWGVDVGNKTRDETRNTSCDDTDETRSAACDETRDDTSDDTDEICDFTCDNTRISTSGDTDEMCDDSRYDSSEQPPSKKFKPSEDTEDEVLGKKQTVIPQVPLEEDAGLVLSGSSETEILAVDVCNTAGVPKILQRPLEAEHQPELEPDAITIQAGNYSTESRQSSRPSSAFYVNGSIDQDDQTRRKGEVLI